MKQGSANGVMRRWLLQAAWLVAATGSVAAAVAQVPAATSASSAAAPAILLANLYRDQIDPSLYLVSEKYDGVRALWDGHTLRFRSGRPVPAPAWFVQRLPPEPLDGELWLARGRFDAVSAIVRKDVPVDADWQSIHYMVFELPGASGSFEARAQAIRALVERLGWPQVRAVEQTRGSDVKALRQRLAQTVKAGGEGLMLHLAAAPYETGRSDVLLKLKPYLDTEATVVGHRTGKGRNTGRLGALEVQMPDGRRFLLGSGFSDAQRADPPAIGAVVTYRYRDLTASGLPRFASFLRVREPQ